MDEEDEEEEEEEEEMSNIVPEENGEDHDNETENNLEEAGAVSLLPSETLNRKESVELWKSRNETDVIVSDHDVFGLHEGEEDSLEVWRLLGREVLTRPGPALTSWVASLPALVLETRGRQRLELLELCLEISKTGNSSLAGAVTERWGEIQESVSQEQQEGGEGDGVSARMMRTLGFIQHHCHRVTAG